MASVLENVCFSIERLHHIPSCVHADEKWTLPEFHCENERGSKGVREGWNQVMMILMELHGSLF